MVCFVVHDPQNAVVTGFCCLPQLQNGQSPCIICLPQKVKPAARMMGVGPGSSIIADGASQSLVCYHSSAGQVKDLCGSSQTTGWQLLAGHCKVGHLELRNPPLLPPFFTCVVPPPSASSITALDELCRSLVPDIPDCSTSTNTSGLTLLPHSRTHTHMLACVTASGWRFKFWVA